MTIISLQQPACQSMMSIDLPDLPSITDGSSLVWKRMLHIYQLSALPSAKYSQHCKYHQPNALLSPRPQSYLPYTCMHACFQKIPRSARGGGQAIPNVSLQRAEVPCLIIHEPAQGTSRHTSPVIHFLSTLEWGLLPDYLVCGAGRVHTLGGPLPKWAACFPDGRFKARALLYQLHPGFPWNNFGDISRRNVDIAKVHQGNTPSTFQATQTGQCPQAIDGFPLFSQIIIHHARRCHLGPWPNSLHCLPMLARCAYAIHRQNIMLTVTAIHQQHKMSDRQPHIHQLYPLFPQQQVVHHSLARLP